MGQFNLIAIGLTELEPKLGLELVLVSLELILGWILVTFKSY
jgi:hypothetical protein